MSLASKSLRLGAAVAALVAVSWVACGSDPGSSPSTGGGDAGGAAGTGSAGAGGTSPGGAGGGGAGSGGSAATDGGVEWGAAPQWEATGQVAAGCPIERLANAKDVKALAWKPCSWSADCEEAVFNPALLGTDAAFTPGSSLHDDGVSVRIGLALESSKHSVVFASSDGSALDGIRGTLGPTECHFWSGAQWGGRIAVMTGPLGSNERGGVLADIGTKPSDVVSFALQSPPPGTPQRTPLGEKRWLWWWAPVARFSTVSAVDGSDFTMFAKEGDGQTALLSGPISAGAIFLFDEWVLEDGGDAQRRISWSDGKQAPAAYLTPPVWTDDFGAVAFANSHVGFMRGVKRKGINSYDEVEVWASPFSETPSQLKPETVAKLTFTGMPDLAGGHGVLATATAVEPGGGYTFTAWDLATKATREFVLPKERVFKAFLGVSREHVYIGAAKPNTGPSAYLVRYPVK